MDAQRVASLPFDRSSPMPLPRRVRLDWMLLSLAVGGLSALGACTGKGDRQRTISETRIVDTRLEGPGGGSPPQPMNRSAAESADGSSARAAGAAAGAPSAGGGSAPAASSSTGLVWEVPEGWVERRPPRCG